MKSNEKTRSWVLDGDSIWAGIYVWIYTEACSAAVCEPRTGGMNAAWAHRWGEEGDYNPLTRLFCDFYLNACH